MLERYRPAPVGTLWVDMPHVHPDVEPLGTVQDDDPEPPRASTAERHYELKSSSGVARGPPAGGDGTRVWRRMWMTQRSESSVGWRDLGDYAASCRVDAARLNDDVARLNDET